MRVIILKTTDDLEAFSSVKALLEKYPTLESFRNGIYNSFSRRKKPFVIGDSVVYRLDVNNTSKRL